MFAPPLPLPRRRGGLGDQEVATCAHGTSVISAVTVLPSSLQAGVRRKPGPPVFPLACTRQEYPDADRGKGRERGPLGPGGQDTALLETCMWLCLRGQVQGAGTLVPGPTPSGNSQPHLQAQWIHIHGEKAREACEHIGTQRSSKGLPPPPVGQRTKIHQCWQPGSHHICAAVMPQTFH